LRPALVIACALAAGYGIGVTAGPWRPRAADSDDYQARQDEAIQNLQRQVEKLARLDGSSCRQDFSALDSEDALRISLFHAYDDHEGKVYDRLNSSALLHVLTSPCRGRLSACDFSVVSRSTAQTSLTRTVRGRKVEIHLFTTSLPEDLKKGMNPISGALRQDELSRSVKERFYRELVASDIVFYMGHSRLGGGMGFDHQSGATTLVNSILRLPMAPVLDALRQRPTRLRVLGMFSCNSEGYFRDSVRQANPSLSLILTSGELRYGPGEQTSFGALEAVLSRYCGHAFHESMIAAGDPEPSMTRRFPGREDRLLIPQ
jgi:hypothetical protein